MNGREIEHLLSAIEENILRDRATSRREIFSYIHENEPEVLESLRRSGKATIPTSNGSIDLNLSELEQLA